jgi:hypothetical protein
MSFLAVLRLAFLKTSGKSPITLEEGIILKLNGQLKFEKNKWIYLNNEPII